jgi:hypothetical protein
MSSRPHERYRLVDVDENSQRYEGWRVALASAVGVLVSFASVLLYSFSVLLRGPICRRWRSRRDGVSLLPLLV